MNFYEEELGRIQRNFDFSFKIYDRQPLLQRTLCIQTLKKLERLHYPGVNTRLYPAKKRLKQRIQAIYTDLRSH